MDYLLKTNVMAVRMDLFESPDYYQLDELLSEEHLMVRTAVRDYVKKEISPIIEDYAQKAEFPQQIVKQLGDLGCFGPTVPVEYGGGGLDYISYGIMMQELERGDSGVRSTASVQGSLVMFPIHAYGSEEQKKKYLPKLASGEWLGCFVAKETRGGGICPPKDANGIIQVHLFDGIDEYRGSFFAGLFSTTVHGHDGIIHHFTESCSAQNLFYFLGLCRQDDFHERVSKESIFFGKCCSTFLCTNGQGLF
jgi:hypothetical protein